jgi:hypothetical protein
MRDGDADGQQPWIEPDEGAGGGGSESLLNESFDPLRQALATYPPDHPSRVAFLMENFHPSFEITVRTHGPDDEAGDAVEASSTVSGDDMRVFLLGALSGVLISEHQRTGDRADIDAALDTARAALALTSHDEPDYPIRLANTCEVLRLRHASLGQRKDLDEAITVGLRAIAMTPSDHPGRAGVLFLVGRAASSKYELTGAVGDLDTAIELCRQAVETMSADDPNRANCLDSFCTVLHQRFDRTRQLEDLDALVAVSEELVASTPTDDPDRDRRLGRLSDAIRMRVRFD